ncbi:MAG TPA: DNA polymerase/3'-5' exonuclease PolX [Anaerolineales bacterium]|nr:DNA polymerase/3'-5' exonuclease PolX [Anaerolineales bacterium]
MRLTARRGRPGDVTNEEVARVFDAVADLLEIKGESVYRVLSYRRAAESIRAQGRRLTDLQSEGRLKEIPGVGDAIAAKIEELLTTGRLGFYENLADEVPPGLIDVLKVGGVGPKKAARFWRELGVTNLAELEAAARDGRLRELSGMGAKSEATILKNIERLASRETARVSLGVALPTAESLTARLRALPGVVAAEPAGSVRRRKETVGDLDLLVGAGDPADVLRRFVAFEDVERVLGQGETKASVELVGGLRAQLWVHPPERYGSALQYATGSQSHNVQLREWALDRGYSLSEHGLKSAGGEEVRCPEESEVYRVLGLPWIPPELREGLGEIQDAARGALPALVEETDVRGEMHAHSDWSDGGATVAAMAEAALARGLEYLVISDHSQSLGVVNGLSPERLRKQRAEIDRVQRRLGNELRLLHGAEVEILADGTLDFDDTVLAGLDVVIAAIHLSLRQPREMMMTRLLNAIRNPHVDVVGHPTGRMIGSREASDLDMEAVFSAAADHGVALEINAHPARLDLGDSLARRAWQVGCLVCINTDAHVPGDFDLRRYGVGVARRAGLPAEAILNTRSAASLQAWLDTRGGRA